MALANENYFNIQEIYYSNEIEKRVNAYKLLHPAADIIRLTTADVTHPLPKEAIKAIKKAADEMGVAGTFRGYSPAKGYDFLIEKIVKDYRTIGITIDKECVFINSGAKPDLGNIGHILGIDNITAVAEPVCPMYENSIIISGRGGYVTKDNKWSNIVYIPCDSTDDFAPNIPQERVDVVYLCNPNNPTGTVITKSKLKEWVDYAIRHQSIIVYDCAYQGFLSSPDVPKSIYEIKGAKRVAVEIHSYSKCAGFTGLRCGYSVFPAELQVYAKTGEKIALLDLWTKRNANYTNGVPYIIQRAAEALYSKKGQREVDETVSQILSNAALIKETLTSRGLKVWGGVDSPYVWLKVPGRQSSWKFFTHLLYESQVVGIPGNVFGTSGEGYMRLTGFATPDDTQAAVDRLQKVKL
ncbi:MAG: LL-diaminopimelate aminotransferase [Prevotellaceae bacterium]|jgi:LL-diaminopimelate aminotransferase|nr:LL-diaminopimelate aminotransferase [Prevotellaceae bacterium]